MADTTDNSSLENQPVQAVGAEGALLPPKEYAHNQEPFEQVDCFEDELPILRRQERRSRWKKRLRRAVGSGVGFALGVASSYTASILWDVVPVSSSSHPTPMATCPVVDDARRRQTPSAGEREVEKDKSIERGWVVSFLSLAQSDTP